MLDAGVLIFPQGLATLSNLLTNATFTVKVQAVSARAAYAKL